MGADDKPQVLCSACNAPASYAQHTATVGRVPFCAPCTKKELSFGRKDLSPGFWSALEGVATTEGECDE